MQTSQDVKSQILDFLRFNGYAKTAEKFESEVAQPPMKPLAHQPQPKIISFFDQSSVREGRQKRLNREYSQLKQVQSATLEQAKAIFTIAINCLQHLHSLKEGSVSPEGLGEAIENYKVELGRYHKILLTEMNSDSNSHLFSEQVL